MKKRSLSGISMQVLVGGKKNSVEINKTDFAGYRRDRKFFGLIQSITLFHQLPAGSGEVPAGLYKQSFEEREGKVAEFTLPSYPS